MLPENIKTQIEISLDNKVSTFNPLSGGDTSNAGIIKCQSGEEYFVKFGCRNESFSDIIFIKEANGLKELAKAEAITTPKVYHSGPDIIITEKIISNSKSKNFFIDFGRKLAKLHKFKSDHFGFHEDNFIGANLQINTPSKTTPWSHYYFNRRILFQFRLSEKSGLANIEYAQAIYQLEKIIPDLFSDYADKDCSASLLHGDLWSGNFITDKNGEACIIDPAVYYGHREADLAMTKLFGGFPQEFYESYNQEYPLKSGYKKREDLYKLYHLMNHLNIFGGSYYPQVMNCLKTTLLPTP